MITARKLALQCGLVLVPLLLLARMFGLTLTGEDLTPRWAGDQLLVAAPKLHFLTGKPLERLKNGAAVPFDFQLSVSTGKGNPALQRALERFVISYDLWEEKFTVVRLQSSRRSGMQLTANAAEAWCLENIALPTVNIPANRSLWVKLEIRSAESKPAPPTPDESGISLTALVDAFSRPNRNSQDHWMLETGPFKLTDLRR